MSLILSGTDGLSDVDGSAATPAIRGTDTNTGIFFPAADTVGVATGGSERMRITSAGNLGVNTTTPATEGANAKIAIVGAAAQNASTLATSNSQAAFTIRADANSGYCMNFGNLVTSGFPYLQGAVFNGGASSSDISLNPFGGNVGIGTSSPSTRLHTYTASGENKLIVEAGAASQSATLSLQTNNTTPGQCLIYMGKTGASTNGQVGYDPNNNFLYLYTNNAERMRIESSGSILMGLTSSTIGGDGGKVLIDGGASLALLANRTSDGNIVRWYRSSSNVGNINVTTTATAYNTSSDYRLKENIVPMTGALSIVAQLKPVTYKWKIDGSDGQGFIAHELQAVVPDAVTGEKDAVDANGNPDYQGVDTSFLVATLTAAIQEQQSLITTLTARITALETK